MLSWLGVLWLVSAVKSVSITLPDANTVWSTTTPNTVVWSPEPATAGMTSPLFDLWLRNYGPWLQDPINVSIAAGLDSTVPPYQFSFLQANLLPPGPNYQLFAAMPGDASIVYADSPVFSVGTSSTTAAGSSSSPASSTSETVAPSSSSAATPQTSSKAPSRTTSTAVAATTETRIQPAVNPGGPLQQGFQYEHLFSQGNRNSLSLAQGATTLAAVAAAFAFLMF